MSNAATINAIVLDGLVTIDSSHPENQAPSLNELSMMAKAIYTILTSKTEFVDLLGHRFAEEVIPEGMSLPAALFVRMGGRDLQGAFGSRLGTREQYQIKGVCAGDSFGPLEGVADIIDAAFQGLHQYTFTTDNGEGDERKLLIQGIRRVDTIKYSESTSGSRRNHMGGVYEIWSKNVTF